MVEDIRTDQIKFAKQQTVEVSTEEIQPQQEFPLNLQDYFGEKMMLVALNPKLRGNALTLLNRVNRFMLKFGEQRRVVCGFLPTPEEPEKVPLLLPSRHQSAEAVDLADPEGDLDQWVLDNQKLLETCALWAEHPASTRGHCHLQSVPPKGGRRVFYP